jgi:signal peptidase I
LLAALLVWLISALITSPKVVSRSSMEPALHPGDLVLINKWALGARTPISLGIPFTGLRFPGFSFPPARLPGFSSLDRGDVILYNYPLDTMIIDRKRLHVKRCIAIPGDTIGIRNQTIYINRTLFQEDFENLMNYEIRCSNAQIQEIIKLVDTEERKLLFSDKGLHLMNLTPNEVSEIKKQFPKVEIATALYDNGAYLGHLYPAMNNRTWTPDNFGPFFVPAKGDSVLLDAENLLLYNRLISRYEGKTIENRGDSILINGEYTLYYQFEQNYYFAIGDNRHNSIDSRHWGLIPENHIIGKVGIVLFSIDPQAKWYKKIRWTKLFHTP